MARIKENTLGDRVTQLIGQFWGGTVYAAAKGWGVPLQTLYRVANGETPNPRATVLTRIASACGTTVEWLLSGVGEGPAKQDASGIPLNAGYLRWKAAVDKLELEPMASDAVYFLGFTLYQMTHELDRQLGIASNGMPISEESELWNIEELNLWAARLESYIERFGARRIADAFRRRVYCAMVGYGPNATFLLYDPDQGPTFERVLAERFEMRQMLPQLMKTRPGSLKPRATKGRKKKASEASGRKR